MMDTILRDEEAWEVRARPGRGRRLFIVILVVMLAQLIGTMVTTGAMQGWYPTLVKPPWTPPDWLFGPVWMILYALMVWGAWRIWQRLVGLGVPQPWGHVSLRAFSWQLGLNALWSVLFFGWRQPVFAMLEMIVLIVAVIWMIRSYRPISRAASVSQYPYLLWLIFAFGLNAGIVGLNYY